LAFTALAGLASGGCASRVMSHKDEAVLRDQVEFDQAVKIVDLPADAGAPGPGGHASSQFAKQSTPTNAQETAAPPAIEPGDGAARAASGQPKRAKKCRRGKRLVACPSTAIAAAGTDAGNLGAKGRAQALPGKREPELEDAEGFVGRRPAVDPFRVGEKVVLELSYFGVTAGDLTLEVGNFAEVNGRKAYRFAARAVSRSIFAMVYAVDDWAETFVDYATMAPSTYALHVRESKQLREQRMYFDWPRLKAHFWDKRIPKDSNIEEKKLDWDAQAFAQTLFSGPFYLRAFQLKPGKQLAFRVANEGNNYVFTGEVLRREAISTPAGDFNTVVVRPQIQLAGVFQPMGEILFWLTDDDRKFFVRIESKIKIGTIVGVATSIEKGGK
jgi:hypothetical protein